MPRKRPTFLAKGRGEKKGAEKFNEESQAQNEVEERYDAAKLRSGDSVFGKTALHETDALP